MNDELLVMSWGGIELGIGGWWFKSYSEYVNSVANSGIIPFFFTFAVMIKISGYE